MISTAKMGSTKEEKKLVKQQKAEQKRLAKQLKVEEKQRKKEVKKATKEAKKRHVDVDVVLREKGLSTDGSPLPKQDQEEKQQDQKQQQQQQQQVQQEEQDSRASKDDNNSQAVEEATATNNETAQAELGSDAAAQQQQEQQKEEDKEKQGKEETKQDATALANGEPKQQPAASQDNKDAADTSQENADGQTSPDANNDAEPTPPSPPPRAVDRPDSADGANDTEQGEQDDISGSGGSAADNESAAQGMDGVSPRTSPKITRRRWAGRSSIRGAPVQLLPGQEAGPIQPRKDDDDNEEESTKFVEEEIVEDEVDDQVGDMAHEDARATAGYLRDTVERFKEKMVANWDNGTNSGYVQEYRSLQATGLTQTCNAAVAEPNRLKNRYGNILAFDKWRVKLPVVDGNPYTDYINASFVDAYKQPNGYIATQGPVPNSFVDFWRMIWDQRVCTIVMVTHEVEGGRMKCHRYWPDPTSNPPVLQLTYGDVNVVHVSSKPHKHYILRTFSVTRGDEPPRTVRQFAFTSWPDHGVPLTTHEMLGFRNAVNERTEDKTAPIVIHCSAGVGRTGTYIAIDTLVRQALDMGGDLDVREVVASMRMRRCYMVQTEIQYIFIYRAVMDCLRELLHGESRKAEKMMQDEAEQEAMRKAAEDAERAKRIEREREEREIEQARKELLAREETSVDNARAVVTTSIQARMQMLMDAEKRWMENYQKSLQEWNERNQFEAEQYDLTSSLTPVQSRREALKQKGLLI
ncbi:tyrosine phosphatase [Salpingoeca rosetta]|uniref:protein-tyrosine-phosphatase n=1 Tax=Salpingoeca rosetta (strain ATCC 50818 / BSB-021) TaxID=946362 RepID=F2TWG7_SALR5|nr:tyrosine phosphatase [Salpingoeca rosetta]EGD72413.1 tyrosine phosphatase [Salpingoeca rosetta]|eukprot:XP_004998982.1 tyrosine phosphatase [Salpingoeca rosetta]